MNSDELMEDLRWVSAPSPMSLWLWVWLAAGLLVAGLAVLVWWRWRRKKIAGENVPVLPPHIVALEELARLRALMTEDNYLEFVIEVSRILRAYIRGRFGLRAPHRATEEFLMEAAESPQLSDGQQELLAAFLRQCDLVKFARRKVALDRMAGLFDTATRFVEETRQTAEPPALVS